jgi:hypothetical protein
MSGIDASRSKAGVFWPLSPDVTSVEKIAQLRALCALTAAYCGSAHELVGELGRAEYDADAAARALELFDRLPSLRRRHIIATFAAIMRPRRAPR